MCGIHPALSPSSQVPPAPDVAGLGRRHAYCHPGGVSFSHVSHPITLQYL